MTICSENHAHMIAIDGGLRHINNPAIMMELEKQGWRQVLNPKRTYYYEYDTTHPSYKEREKIGMEDDIEVLQVDIL